jgi:hypothetical protein
MSSALGKDDFHCCAATQREVLCLHIYSVQRLTCCKFLVALTNSETLSRHTPSRPLSQLVKKSGHTLNFAANFAPINLKVYLLGL